MCEDILEWALYIVHLNEFAKRERRIFARCKVCLIFTKGKRSAVFFFFFFWEKPILFFSYHLKRGKRGMQHGRNGVEVDWCVRAHGAIVDVD